MHLLPADKKLANLPLLIKSPPAEGEGDCGKSTGNQRIEHKEEDHRIQNIQRRLSPLPYFLST